MLQGRLTGTRGLTILACVEKRRRGKKSCFVLTAGGNETSAKVRLGSLKPVLHKDLHELPVILQKHKRRGFQVIVTVLQYGMGSYTRAKVSRVGSYTRAKVARVGSYTRTKVARVSSLGIDIQAIEENQSYKVYGGRAVGLL
jgi:hypothetical protein